MALFAVGVSLTQRNDCPELWAELDSLGAQEALHRLYLLDLAWTKEALRDHLMTFVEPGDRIFVIEFAGKPAFTAANSGTKDWIDAHC